MILALVLIFQIFGFLLVSTMKYFGKLNLNLRPTGYYKLINIAVSIVFIGMVCRIVFGVYIGNIFSNTEKFQMTKITRKFASHQVRNQNRVY